MVGYNDLATTHPKIAAQWHPVKNLEIKPQDIRAGSNNSRWWQCNSCGHEWSAMTCNRTRKGDLAKCPNCVNDNTRLKVGETDLASKFPEDAKLFHPTKNFPHAPEYYSYGSEKEVWWLGECGHEWKMQVKSKTSGQGCPYCSKRKVLKGYNDLLTLRPELMIEWSSKNIVSPDTQSEFANVEALWVCKTCHYEWKTVIANRTRGSGCPRCVAASQTSQAEEEIAQYIQEKTGIKAQQSIRNIIKGELDIYIPEKKIAIEFNGLYWHSEKFGKDSKYHYRKYQQCQELGIQLIQIWEDDWKDRKETIKTSILHKLQEADPKLRVGARNLKTTEIGFKAAADFLEAHHIQGAVQGSSYYALCSKQNIEDIKAVLVIKKVGNKGHEGEWRIERYATSSHIIGGFTRLLKYAEKELKTQNKNISRWVTFSDNCISDGGLYANNGFTKDSELGPDYMYVKNDKRVHKFNYRLKRFKEDPQLKWQPGLSESQLAELNNLPRIWDAGKIRWVKEVKSR